MDETDLQRLTQRITRLEADLAAMRQQAAMTKATLDDLGNAFLNEVKSTSKHFSAVYGYIKGIHAQLWPVVHTVFPGSARTQRQIAAIFRSGGKSPDRRKR